MFLSCSLTILIETWTNCRLRSPVELCWSDDFYSTRRLFAQFSVPVVTTQVILKATPLYWPLMIPRFRTSSLCATAQFFRSNYAFHTGSQWSKILCRWVEFSRQRHSASQSRRTAHRHRWWIHVPRSTISEERNADSLCLHRRQHKYTLGPERRPMSLAEIEINERNRILSWIDRRYRFKRIVFLTS